MDDSLMTISKVIGIEGVAKIFGCKHTKAWELVRAKEFPKKVNMGRISRWLATEVIAYRDSYRTAGAQVPSVSSKGAA